LALRVIAEFLKRSVAKLNQGSVSEASLTAVADVLRQLAAELALPPADFPPAGPSQELIYALAEDARCGIALYLVSDAPGTVSSPHEHLTWAVIAGIRGVEANTLYRIINSESRRVGACGEVVVAAGQSLMLPERAIHSTAALGATATYHLHLYGKPLRSLPPLRERTYMLRGTAEPCRCNRPRRLQGT
jgi:predicted metal-dependent enzyme (double-stranded beta helix superfamily)